jgi:tetratricopeptide (TPR) repeat protein
MLLVIIDALLFTFILMQEDTQNKGGKLDAAAYYIMLVAVFLAPIIFIPSSSVILDMAKTITITLATLVSLVLISLSSIKSRKVHLPARSLVRTSVLIIISLLVSAFGSIQVAKSIFGQGFEIGTASMIIILFLASFIVFHLIMKKAERALVFYVALAASFILLFIHHVIRMIAGMDVLSLGVLNSLTPSLFGTWQSLGVLASVLGIIPLTAIIFLSLSNKMKIVYWVLCIISVLSMLYINSPRVWLGFGIAMLILTGVKYFMHHSEKKGISGFFSRITWIPAILVVISLVFTFWGPKILRNTTPEFGLPWQLTMDVTNGVIKNYPTFGVGPNLFSQAYIAYKPTVLNTTDAWNYEFTNGFGFVPTLVVGQGLIGLLLWILLYIFFIIFGLKAMKKLPSDSYQRFILVSSFLSSLIIFLQMLVSVPSHALIFTGFVLAGIFAGSTYAYGVFDKRTYAPSKDSRMYSILPAIFVILVIVGVVWAAIYVRKSLALAYFGSGITQLNMTGNAKNADALFAKALAYDNSDVYWRARAEASLADIGQQINIASAANADKSASGTEKVVANVMAEIKNATTYAQNAINFDPANYYNHISMARVSEAAVNLRVPSAYEDAIKSYSSAINLNPNNPSIYLSLARLQASQNKLDDAKRTLGSGLQVKNNYLEGIFLYSQIEAAQGNIKNAIVAAQMAISINTQSPLLYFQLGLLQYTDKDYASAAKSLESAVALQPDYANAKYFLGLSYARLGENQKAVEQFKKLAETNPENQEISFILTNLEAGKSPFADAKPPVTPNPEKRSSLPVKEKNK